MKRLSRSRLLSAAVLAAVFLLLLFCNHETNLLADDYRYCFSYLDGARMEHLAQLLPSMAAHRLTMNGRVIAHTLVQLFLMLPKGIFDILNALLFAALVWLIARLAAREPGPLLLLTVFGCLWLLQPDFGQVFLWLTGAVNYLWCGVLCLLWLLPWRAWFLEKKEPGAVGRAAYVLFSFVVGAYSENATVAMVAMALAFFLALWLTERRRPARWTLLALAAMLGGFLYMMLAPAESVNKSAELRPDVLWNNFLENAGYYLRFWPLLASYLLFYCLAVKNGVGLSVRLYSLVCLFGSLAGHFVLVFAMYTAGRSTYIGLVLLTLSNAALLAPLLKSPRRGLCLGLCGLCLLFTACAVAVGVRDIVRTHGLLTYNEELIAACALNGEREVQLPRPYAGTKYSALDGLGYLDTENPEDWLNVYMARYYGVDRIIGY